MPNNLVSMWSVIVLLIVCQANSGFSAQSSPAKVPEPHPDVAALLRKGGQAYRTYKYYEALRVFEEALDKSRSLNDTAGESVALHNIGVVYRAIGNPLRALEFFDQARLLRRAVGDKRGEASTIDNIGGVYDNIGDPQKALGFYNEALTIRRDVGDKAGEAITLHNLGGVYFAIGQHQKALESCGRALWLRKETGDKIGEAATLHNLARIHSGIGQPQKALEFYNLALSMERDAGDKRLEAATLNHIGLVYDNNGEPQRALEFYNRALLLRREVTDKRGEAESLSSIGVLYDAIGQPDRALEFYNESLSIQKEVGDKRAQAITISSMALAYRIIGQPEKALEFYNQSLLLRREVGDKQGEATTLNNVGAVYYAIGQPHKALEFYNEAMSLQKEVGAKAGEAATLNNIGSVYAEIGQSETALEFYERALMLRREVGDQAGEVTTLSSISFVYELQGRLAASDQAMLSALNIFEGIRASLGGLSAAKVSLLESNLYLYHAYINLLLKQNMTADAIAWAEKTKARALLDLMYDGKVEISAVMTEQERDREREVKWRLGQLNTQLISEMSKSNPERGRVDDVKLQMTQMESDLQKLTDSLYVKYPELARKRAAKTVTLQDLADLLPGDTALLDYVVLKTRHVDKTVLFCATIENRKPVVTAHTIAKRRDDIIELADGFRDACAYRVGRKRYHVKACDLYNLLIAPASKQLEGKKRLIICPDGPLWGLPFQALVVATKSTTTKNTSANLEQFLIERYEIIYAYSATGVRAALLAGGGGKRTKPSGTLLALANPDFGELQDRSAPTAKDVARPVVADSRTIATEIMLRGGGLRPLPGTQREADALKTGFPESTVYTGKEAQEAKAKEGVDRYRYLHFATHGIFNDAAPLMSSIALARPPKGSDEDGFLTAREICDLNWNADMVVLSACNTARGQKQAGEGVVGLTWALFVAGVPTQVLSQWTVADESTAKLMKQFYANIKQGNPRGASLRAASLKLMKDRIHSHPFYWAPFVLVGEWR